VRLRQVPGGAPARTTIEKLTTQIQRLLQDVKRFQYLLHERRKLVSMHATGDIILQRGPKPEERKCCR
jgi:hypothetical protein